MVVVCRMRTDERTRAYVARRTLEGLSKREIILHVGSGFACAGPGFRQEPAGIGGRAPGMVSNSPVVERGVRVSNIGFLRGLHDRMAVMREELPPVHRPNRPCRAGLGLYVRTVRLGGSRRVVSRRAHTFSGDNPDRLRSEASFAMMCGVCPIPASSGKTQRHRLNRGGNRQANSALHMVVVCRMRTDERTRRPQPMSLAGPWRGCPNARSCAA